jgi:translation initiation factor IF-2
MESKQTSESNFSQFPPVVSVLGHVDHGKTTLLDAVRKSNIATGEAGGITQAIGASKIEVVSDNKKRFITFIDTPGHEAFSNMRSHGVAAADIVLLVVAADDGVKPQTKESIEKILVSGLPFIVVITKTDAPGANIEKVKQELAKEGVLLEGLGGEVPYIGVSAKTGDRISELLDLIIIVYDVSEIRKNDIGDFTGVVIEAKLDKRRGILASLIVKGGKIKVSDNVFTESKQVGKVRALIDSLAASVKEATPGDAIEVLGLTEVLPAGTVVNTKAAGQQQATSALSTHTTADLMKILQNKQNEKVPVIVKTQTSGEFEAVFHSLPEDVEVVYEGRGEISVSDILMARDFDAIVVGFNVNIEKQAKTLAESNKTFYRTYNIIYNLLDELKDAVELLHERAQRKVLGKAQILATFEGNEGQILGVRIQEGRLALGDKIVITRGVDETAESKITSLKQGKKDVKEVGRGNECGIMIDPQVDFTIGDMVISCS